MSSAWGAAMSTGRGTTSATATETKREFSRRVAQIGQREAVTISRRGVPCVALLSVEHYQALTAAQATTRKRPTDADGD